MATKPRDRSGRVIPDDHFENEPGPPGPLSDFMSDKSIQEFDAETARIRAAADKLMKKRR